MLQSHKESDTTERLNNTAKLQSPKATLPKPLVGIITGTVATRCYYKTSSASQSAVIRSLVQNAPQRAFFRVS